MDNVPRPIVEQLGAIETKPAKKTIRRLIKWAVLFVVIVFIVGFFRPTLVIDQRTFLPISGATVNYKSETWTGCHNRISGTTFFGITFLPGVFFPCQISVSKEGYHLNGANNVDVVPGIFGFRILFLNKIQDPQAFIHFEREFTLQEPGMDVLSYLRDSQPSLDPSEMIGNQENDFIFTVIKNEGRKDTEYQTIGPIQVKIKFFGEGGVQLISRDDDRGNAGSNYYDIENLLEAPVSGYKEELFLESGKSYIARLRDGLHYMKFSIFATEDLKRESFVCINGYIQPEASKNLEFLDVYENNFCLGDQVDSPEYDLKIKYLELQKVLPTVKSLNYHYGSTDSFLLTELLNTRYSNFIFAPNHSRFTEAQSISGITTLYPGMLVEAKLPPFEIFESNYIKKEGRDVFPVDIFIGGKYLDLSRVRYR